MVSRRKRKKVAAAKKQRQKSQSIPAQSKIIFELKDSIGQSGAEEDAELLSKCFYHGTVFNVMKDITDPRSILIGGTGAGKTAFIEQFYRENPSNCIRIHLDEVSLTYVSNSNILNVLEEIGINLSMSYQIMWKHFLVTQLLKRKFKHYSESNKTDIFNNIVNLFRDQSTQVKAQEYLHKLEGDFWMEPTECIKKTSQEMVTSLEGNVHFVNFASLDAQGIETLKNDKETKSKIQKAIEATQLQILNSIFDFLNKEVFVDDQNPFYILIDELDTNWVVQERKYGLIRSLIETIRTFRKIENVKIIIGLRTDLYDRIIEATRDEGFQHEKHETYLLPISWQRHELNQLVNLRIREVFKNKYKRDALSFNDIAPETIDGVKCFQYLFDRTSYCQIWCFRIAGHAALRSAWSSSMPLMNLTPVITLAR